MYTVYKITNNINGMIYIGQTSTDINSYNGSGVNLLKAYKEFGKDNFTKEILFQYNNKDDMLKKEKELVNESFVKRKDTYNIIIGGGDLMTENHIVVKDGKNYKLIHIDEYKTGKYDFMFKDMVVVKCSDTGNNISITKEEFSTGKYQHICKNKVVVHDNKNPGKFIQISTDEFSKGYYRCMSNGLVSVKDPNDFTKFISITKEEYKSGNYEHVSKNLVSVKCDVSKSGYKKVTKEEYESGVYISHAKGKVTVKNNITGEYMQVNKSDVRFKTGEISGNKKGSKWIYRKDNKFKPKTVRLDELDNYLNDGWFLGRGKLK